MKLRRTLIVTAFLLAALGCLIIAFLVPAESTKVLRFRGIPHPGGAIAVGFILLLCAAGFWLRTRIRILNPLTQRIHKLRGHRQDNVAKQRVVDFRLRVSDNVREDVCRARGDVRLLGLGQRTGLTNDGDDDVFEHVGFPFLVLNDEAPPQTHPIGEF